MCRNILTALPNLTAITEAKSAAMRITEMIDREPAIDGDDKKGKALSYVRGEIQFKGVYFNYPSRPDTPVLQGLEITVPAGRSVGLVGGSGSGKSTIISLLQRFYDPIEGEILLDGYKINRLHLKWLRSQMGLVSQEPVLFATSIKENILFGNEGASMDDVQKAALAANAHDFIMKLPDAYETQVTTASPSPSDSILPPQYIDFVNCNMSRIHTKTHTIEFGDEHKDFIVVLSKLSASTL